MEAGATEREKPGMSKVVTVKVFASMLAIFGKREAVAFS
jgi:hypothetical protein